MAVLLSAVAIVSCASAAGPAKPPPRPKKLEQLQASGEVRPVRNLPDLTSHVWTEDPDLNRLAERLYRECVLSKLYEPVPPALPYRWFSPGGIYVGQWLWDTMFVAAAYAPLDDDVTIRDVFRNYWDTVDRNPEAPKGTYRYGMVPNYLQEWPPAGYSQIPIMAWGCWTIAQQTNDAQLVTESLPYLVAFDEWYSSERDVDADGLIEFGTYKPAARFDPLQTARFEAFDLSPTTEMMKLTRHPTRADSGEWYGNVEGVEQTCFLILSEQALVSMAHQTGQTDLARRFEATIERRTQALRKKMWDPASRFFYSLDRDDDVKIPVRGIQGFLPLTCRAATDEQATALIEQLRDPKQWWCEYPVPTVAMDDPKYMPAGYWQGDMWPATTYLVALGAARYGRHDVAEELTRRMVRLVLDSGVNERYNGRTGEALGIPGIGMTCCVWNMVVHHLYGVQDDYRTIHVPPRATGRRLHLGKLEVSFPDDQTVELRTAFPREFRVVFSDANGPQRPVVSCDGLELSPEQFTANDAGVVFRAEANRRYLVRQRS